MVNIIKINKFEITISILLILVISFFAFYPSLKNNFTNWDDNTYVTENPFIQSLSSVNLKKIFTSFFAAHYQPVTILSYLIDYNFFKLNPFGYHLTNLVLHLLNCLLVFWLIFILTGRVLVSWVITILFGIHPLQVESVAWISERKNVLYALFFLGAMISYLYYLKRGKKLKYYCFCLFLFILSLLSKSMAVTLPLALFLMDYLFRRKLDKIMFIEKIPLFALSLVFGIIAIFGAHSSGAIRQEGSYSLLSMLMVASYSIVFYLNKIFLPIRLSCLYPYHGTGNFLVYSYPIITIAVLLIGVIISGKYTKKVIFGAGLFLFTILPVLQFIPTGEIIVADRYVYISAIGVYYILTEGLFWLHKRKENYIRSQQLLFLIVCITILLVPLTWKRCQVWKDGITLWNDVLKNYSNSSIAYNNRGITYYDRGNLNQALLDYNKAIEINPKYDHAYYNRGITYYDKGEIDLAISDYSKAIEVNHNYADAYYNRGNAYSSKGSIDQAISDYSKAIELNSGFASAYNNRAAGYFLKEKYDEAWEDMHRAEVLGYKVHPGFIEDLKKASGK